MTPPQVPYKIKQLSSWDRATGYDVLQRMLNQMIECINYLMEKEKQRDPHSTT